MDRDRPSQERVVQELVSSPQPPGLRSPLVPVSALVSEAMVEAVAASALEASEVDRAWRSCPHCREVDVASRVCPRELFFQSGEEAAACRLHSMARRQLCRGQQELMAVPTVGHGEHAAMRWRCSSPCPETLSQTFLRWTLPSTSALHWEQGSSELEERPVLVLEVSLLEILSERRDFQQPLGLKSSHCLKMVRICWRYARVPFGRARSFRREAWPK